MNRMLNLDDDQIQRMEQDLIDKVEAAYRDADIENVVYGVYNLDDLERKTADDLCAKIGVGVGYVGCEKVTPDPGTNVAGGPRGNHVRYAFAAILAVPANRDCEERYTATKLLTVLRKRIHGSTVSGDQVARKWEFEREAPNVTESTDTVLYYSQVWHLTLPLNVIPKT